MKFLSLLQFMGVQSPQDFEAVRADQAQFGTP
jgi:hypothetical protein